MNEKVALLAGRVRYNVVISLFKNHAYRRKQNILQKVNSSKDNTKSSKEKKMKSVTQKSKKYFSFLVLVVFIVVIFFLFCYDCLYCHPSTKPKMMPPENPIGWNFTNLLILSDGGPEKGPDTYPSHCIVTDRRPANTSLN